MEDKELRWLQKRIGCFCASEISSIMSASGKWTLSNIDFLYTKQRERKKRFPAPQIYVKQFNFGNDNEPYAIEWLKVNKPELNIKHCLEDFDDIIFVKTDYNLGASPDCIVEDKTDFKKNALVEIKCIYGEREEARMFSDTYSYDKKRLGVFKEHKDQLAVQLICFPSVNNIWVLKYSPQRDDNDFDTDSPTESWRGILFEFTRDEFGDYLNEIEERAKFADEYLKSGRDLENINDYYKNKKNVAKDS
ncbi:MAG: YqaJ viral recombinase family protein [Christensenellaceae bacterium]